MPCDELAENKLSKVPAGEELEWSVNTKQNGKLHRKIFAFFAFCTKHYYGDEEAAKVKALYEGLCNPKADLVKKVETLENEKAFLENQLNNALAEIKRLTNG